MDPKKKRTDPLPAKESAHESKTIRILLIENDQDSIFLVAKNLEAFEQDSIHFELKPYNNLRDAMSHYSPNQYDLALLDLNLPDTQGLQTLKLFRENAATLPVVILSSDEDGKNAPEAVKNGAEDFLFKSKVENTESLARSIMHALERHQMRFKLATITQELKATSAKLERLATIDQLTGIMNRGGLQQLLGQRQNEILRKGSEHVAILMDLDNFKKINNAFGHAAGDIVLREVSENLKHHLRREDYIARIGGDEFLIILSDTKPSHGILVAEKIRLAINDAVIVFASGPLRITASFSVGTIPLDLSSPDELVVKMQFILRENKKGGVHNRIFCEKKLQKYHDAGKDILSKIVHHMQAGTLIRSVKQPIYHLPSHEITGYEFLTRLTIGDFQMADEFFQLVMEANILTLVDHHCYRAALAASLQTPGHDCHLNLFPSTILAVGADRLIDDIPPANRNNDTRYCIELSEKQIIGNPSYLAESVKALKHAGIHFGIDDIGYGNSCLENIIHLEPDFIKIDRKCLVGIETNPEALKYYKRLLSVAAGLDIKVVAEGIEKQVELDVLKTLGVQYGQGYFLGRPS